MQGNRGLSDLEGRRIALIGGAGFIGHNLALMLHACGAKVAIIDSLGVNNMLTFQSTDNHSPDRELYLDITHQRLNLLREKAIELYVQDARDYLALAKLMKKAAPDTFIHLAAVAHAGKSNKDPYTTFDHSLRTLENALDCARSRCQHFIYFSSSMVYGDFTGASVTEESPCEPLGIYGALKYAGEKIVIAYNQVFDLPYTIVRPSALYGERCVSRRVSQIFIENALRGDDITVQGDGSDRLDFTYIQDLCHGIIQVLARKQALNQIFNLTYGESCSVAQLVGILKQEFPNIRAHYQERDRLMPKRGTLNVDKARELIDYRPSWPLERGLPKYIEWYRSLNMWQPVEDRDGMVVSR
ncbi:MAG: NAD(P)-dependent oxidoreductase [Candidatus Eisenbacteria sp.]|nr:NAD(P)-dependent oxidoreductase [Candidatus Eisenbacteria bacterium]